MADLSGRRATDGPPVQEYLGPMLWPEDEILAGIVTQLQRDGVPIHVGPDAGRTLQLLVAATGARRVLEIGTLAGYSAIWMARALPADGRIDSIEVDPEHAAWARDWLVKARVADRVRVLVGSALDVLPGLDGPYDLAFVDAHKTEYPAYLEHLLRLVRPGGLICADNAIWGGRVADPRVVDDDTEGLRIFLRAIADDARLLSMVLPVGDGLSVSLVRTP